MSGPEPADTITAATATLLSWLSTVGVGATMAPPTADRQQLGVWPVALLPEQATRHSGNRAPLRLRVRYLLAGGDAGQLARDLDRVLAGSLSATVVQLVLEPVPAAIWQGFGLPPGLGMYVDVPVRVAAPLPPGTPRVRTPMLLDTQRIGRVHGTVLGPGGIAMPGVRIALPETGDTTYTGNRGEFTFPAFPAGRPVRLQLSGRGLDLVAEVARQSDEPIVIHCDMEGV